MKNLTKILIGAGISLCIIGIALIVLGTPVTTNADNSDNSDICAIDTYNVSPGYSYETFYDKDTGVCYIVIGEGVTPLYNADGTLKIYKERK